MGESLLVAIVAAIPACLAYLQGRTNHQGQILLEGVLNARTNTLKETVERRSTMLEAKAEQIHTLVNSKMTQALLTIEAQDLKLTSALNTIGTQAAEISNLQKMVAALQIRLGQL